MVCKYFLLVYSMSYHLLCSVFHRKKDFNFDEVQLNVSIYGLHF